jgi:hypothetical protein
MWVSFKFHSSLLFLLFIPLADHVINNDWAFVLLEGALTDWPNDENTLWFDESTPNSDNF